MQNLDEMVDPSRLEACRSLFAEQGFVLVPDLVSAADIERYGQAIDDAVDARVAADPRGDLRERSGYERSFRQCINLWEDAPAVRPFTFHPVVAAVAAALLDVPGSHQFGVRKFANIFTARGFDLENGPEARGVAPVFVPAQAGSVIFHHGLTIHTAGANQASETRRAHTMIYFADGCSRSDSQLPHPSVDRAGIAVGAPIDSIFTPIAHPRPAGDLPETPPPMDEPKANWPGGKVHLAGIKADSGH